MEVDQLRERLGARLRLVGVGGARMAEQGVASPFDIADLSVLGFVEGASIATDPDVTDITSHGGWRSYLASVAAGH